MLRHTQYNNQHNDSAVVAAMVAAAPAAAWDWAWRWKSFDTSAVSYLSIMSVDRTDMATCPASGTQALHNH